MLMLLKHINTIAPPVLTGTFGKSINITLGSVEANTRIPLELKARRTISVIGTVTGNVSIPQAIFTTTLDPMVLALLTMEEALTVEEVPIVEGILLGKMSSMVGSLLMTEKVVVAQIVPTMRVAVRTKTFRRLGSVPVLRLASMVKAIAMAKAIVIITHWGSPHHEACKIRL